MKGKLGIEAPNNLLFIHEGEDNVVDISLGDIDIKEGKDKLDALEFRDEKITEEELKEMIGFDYEDVKFFDNKETDYEVSDVYVSAGIENHFTVRYYAKDDEFDEIQTTTTKKGKEVEIIDDGLFVEWFWEDEGYNYLIDGNYNDEEEADIEKKEYILEVIDKVTKAYGE